MQLATFEQWQACFCRMKNGEAAAREIQEADIADLRLSAAAEREFIAQLESAVNAFLNRAGGRLSRMLRELSEEGAIDEIPTAARRFRREVRDVLFIRRLSFLRAAYRQELERAIRQQLDGTWQNFLISLRNQALQTPSAALEDLIWSLRKFRLLDE